MSLQVRLPWVAIREALEVWGGGGHPTLET